MRLKRWIAVEGVSPGLFLLAIRSVGAAFELSFACMYDWIEVDDPIHCIGVFALLHLRIGLN